jgi:hypothetical protein
MNADDFFEEDESVEKIKTAFERGEKRVTARPVRQPARGQTAYLSTGVLAARPSQSLSTSRLAGQANHS